MRRDREEETEIAPLVECAKGQLSYSFFPLFSSYIYNLVNDAASVEHSTKSVFRDFAQDGVVYLELRTTPRAMPSAGLDKAGYVRTVLRALDAAARETPTLHARLILSIDRRNTLAEALEVVSLATAFRDQGVVAIDLCGDPMKGDVSLFTPAVEKARAAGLKVTIHFAEAEASASEAELATIMAWMPHRLGHVIHVPDAVKRQISARTGIGLELCLSCNVHAKMIVGSFEAHHFGEWWRVEGPVVVPCVSSTLSPPLTGNSMLRQLEYRLPLKLRLTHIITRRTTWASSRVRCQMSGCSSRSISSYGERKC